MLLLLSLRSYAILDFMGMLLIMGVLILYDVWLFVNIIILCPLFLELRCFLMFTVFSSSNVVCFEQIKVMK